MKRVGIELNNVLRNFNYQVLKYFKKDYDPSLDLDSVDDKGKVIGKLIQFPTKQAEFQFVYEDYPYELFGCAKTMEKNLARDLNKLLYDITNIEDEQYEIKLFGLDEAGLSLQSTYFFASRYGLRVREMFFPESKHEVFDKCDVVVCADERLLVSDDIPEGKKVVVINRPFNKDIEVTEEKLAGRYDTLTDFIADFEKARKNF